MKKKICCLFLITLLATGCGKIPKLENGKDAVVSFNNDEKISVDDLYNNLKDTYGLSSLVVMIDTYVLEKTFDDYIDTAHEYAKSYITTIRENFESEEAFLQALSQNLGIQSVEAYENQIYLSYMQTHAAEEYARLQITDKQIEDYYENEVVGDIEISHILITPEVTDEMTDEEKSAAEETAKAEAREIINTLKNTDKDKIADTFKELAKEHSDDAATKDNGGSLGRINKNTLSSKYNDLVETAYDLEDGEFATTFVTTELGYHVILRTKSYEKDTLKKAKDSIIKVLSEEYMNSEAGITIKALQHYRKELGMEIHDSELDKLYSNYVQNQLANALNTQN
ncbi:MAG: peptidylprolyl isomerase [Bacilli bacterium]|nr:peptidylprolyl isomerase [Bacilli bacterium]